jgi:hypothetical protein
MVEVDRPAVVQSLPYRIAWNPFCPCLSNLNVSSDHGATYGPVSPSSQARQDCRILLPHREEIRS